MKKQLLTAVFGIAALAAVSQTPRLSLYEEFTGETCPPCAATNPGLDALLAQPTNTTKIAVIKWQVPIPSAPTTTWSLYQTNKVEIDWRYRPVSAGGYGYPSSNAAGTQTAGYVNSAPQGRIDGQHQWAFGATSDHPANLNNNVISTAQSYTSAFSITMDRAWDATASSVNLTISILATADFSATGNLVFRTVMVERDINFATQPGTNGEKDFHNVVIKSFPNIQNGTPLTANWTTGNTYSFTLNCPVPSYARDKAQIAFVGFIQDDGNRKVAQAVRAERDPLPNDIKAVSASVPEYMSCANEIYPEITVKNNGSTTITDFTVTPYFGAVASPDITVWTGNLAPDASMSIPLNAISTSVMGGGTCILNITAVSGTDGNTSNNQTPVNFYLIPTYTAMTVSEGFVATAFPPAKWGMVNANGGASWSRAAAGYAPTTAGSAKYDFFSNSVKGDADELILPPMDLAGDQAILTWDLAYAQYGSENDSLKVYMSNDCGNSWNLLWADGGSNMATRTPITSAFTPAASQWVGKSASLNTAFDGAPLNPNLSSVLVKFVARSDYGNNLYLDNINIKTSVNAPIDLAAANDGISLENHVTWSDNSNYEDSYNLYYSSDVTPYALLATLPANTTTYDHTGLDELTTYCYKAVAVKAGVESDFSNQDCADTPELITGINAVKGSNIAYIGLYPNPAHNDMTLKISVLGNSTAAVSVINVLGQIVYKTETGLNVGENTISLSVAQLPEGVYNVVINTDKGTAVKKLSVVH
ncbi:MAG: T9SS type A sorting domain-containing protein [Bacteroidetes bacterium]|nr:T9SS type A sorting domain-containing protein [Bacteroidota bacterium]